MLLLLFEFVIHFSLLTDVLPFILFVPYLADTCKMVINGKEKRTLLHNSNKVMMSLNAISLVCRHTNRHTHTHGHRNTVNEIDPKCFAANPPVEETFNRNRLQNAVVCIVRPPPLTELSNRPYFADIFCHWSV